MGGAFFFFFFFFFFLGGTRPILISAKVQTNKGGENGVFNVRELACGVELAGPPACDWNTR